MSKNNSNIAIHPSHSAAEVVTTELRHPGFGLKKLTREWPYRPVLCRWAAILLIATGMQIPIFQTLHATTPKNEESGAKSTVKKITDGGITSAVEDELIFESEVSRSMWMSARAKGSSLFLGRWTTSSPKTGR